MTIMRYLIPALSIAGAAHAASCGSKDTLTVTAAAAASSIAACSTYSGDIVMSTGVADGGKLDLGQLQKIDGSFTYHDDDTVETISATGLESVGDLNLTNLVHLSALDMSSLSDVGDMTLIGLGALNQLGFGTPGIKHAGRVTIINTQIAQLNGINEATEIEGLIVSDNRYLSQIGMNISKVGSIDIGPNNAGEGSGRQEADFPKLMTATFLNFRNCTTVSLPNLTNVSTFLGLYGNLFEDFQAPKLAWAGGIVANDNSKLSNLSFPELKMINSSNATLQIANNTELKKVDGFPLLTNVKGNIDISGHIDEITFLKSIKTVAGALDVDTSSDSFNCDDVRGLSDTSGQVVRGHVNCKASDSNPTSTTGDQTSSSGSDSSSSSSSGAAVPLDVPTFMTGTGVLAGLLSLLL